MIAILSLHDEMISPPTDEEKAEAKRWVKKQVCEAWENGYLSVDGTTFNLFQKPGHHGETFFDRKSNYSLSAQITTLPHNLKIVDYGLGHTGSVHDLSAFCDTAIYQTPEKFFTAGEWLWGDSAYPVSPTCVLPFKRVPNQALTRQQRHFNYHLSRVQIRSKHAIGLLKIRFQSLKELCIQINCSQQIDYAISWIRCCFILHNFIIRIEGQDHNSRNNINRDWQLELDELLADGIEDVGDDNGKDMPVNLP
ncbi:hypothetical protein SERLADRAFT_360716 [Serpula lacrymans var. lacrymans S7.9]|uniref:DDE Tnp4 domain-containing protein n=2 Tax=Serpula lacrymans var. lacrymans TaxID=341189 RepID=F8NSJ9_SERL9|nr:uncharacterized protein SERLADRAFT_360716 [Serpula lacrymans var. lacrymans S7.9]EGO26454.1 hypothetical protein SERLADRAFT_360716 [Serpula lacrymans var. lacrymans S7.9]